MTSSMGKNKGYKMIWCMFPHEFVELVHNTFYYEAIVDEYEHTHSINDFMELASRASKHEFDVYIE